MSWLHLRILYTVELDNQVNKNIPNTKFVGMDRIASERQILIWWCKKHGNKIWQGKCISYPISAKCFCAFKNDHCLSKFNPICYQLSHWEMFLINWFLPVVLLTTVSLQHLSFKFSDLDLLWIHFITCPAFSLVLFILIISHFCFWRYSAHC